MGRTFFTLSDRNARITKNIQGYQLSSISNQKIETGDKIREYKVNYQYSNDFDLLQVKLQDADSDDAVEILYDGWERFQNNL